MLRRFIVILLPAVLLTAAAGLFTPAELDAHRQWMVDAQDRKDDIREELAAKNQAKLLVAVKSLDALTVKEQNFWARTSIQPAKDLAVKNRKEAAILLAAAKAGQFAEAEKAFSQLEKTCTACHDLHFEKDASLKPR